MSDLNELAVAAGGSVLAELPQMATDLFNDLPAITTMPFILLEGSQSTKVKEDKVDKGNFTLNTRRDEFQILGSTFECLVIDVRFKAIDLTDKKNLRWTFKPGSDLAKEIEKLANDKDPAVKRGRLYGLEFLLYLPDVEPEAFRYCTFYLGNASGRVETPRFKPVMRKSALLKIDKAKNDKGIWEVAKVHPSSRKIEPDDIDTLQRTVADFKAPKEMSDVKKKEDAPADVNAEAERG